MALIVKNLEIRYGALKAVNNVNFQVEGGEIIGYLGPNGAGKTSTLKALAGILKPTSGKILFNGKEVWNDVYSYKTMVGYVPEDAALYPYMSGYEYLLFVGRLRGIEEKTLKRKAENILSIFGLENYMHLSIDSYSKGMKQKVLISSALIHNPDIILLDEPLSGLDSFTVFTMREIIKGLASKGKIIIYASHILEVVERLCSRVIIINRGKILADENVEKLKELRRSASLEEVFKSLVVERDPAELASRFLTELEKNEGA